jgi:hypothetical protein
LEGEKESGGWKEKNSQLISKKTLFSIQIEASPRVKTFSNEFFSPRIFKAKKLENAFRNQNIEGGGTRKILFKWVDTRWL